MNPKLVHIPHFSFNRQLCSQVHTSHHRPDDGHNNTRDNEDRSKKYDSTQFANQPNQLVNNPQEGLDNVGINGADILSASCNDTTYGRFI